MFYSKKLKKFSELNHCFFSRKGGHSKGLYKGLNCGRGSKVNGICYRINPKESKHQSKPNLGLDGKPFSVVNYLNGPGSIFAKKNFFYYANRKRLSDFDYDDIEFDHFLSVVKILLCFFLFPKQIESFCHVVNCKSPVSCKVVVSF